MNYLKFETREKTNKFLLDPVINEFNNQIIKIRNLRIPGTIVIEGGEPQVIYDCCADDQDAQPIPL